MARVTYSIPTAILVIAGLSILVLSVQHEGIDPKGEGVLPPLLQEYCANGIL
jgi:hypothetical protein